MLPIELLVSWGAIVLGWLYIMYMQHQLEEQDNILNDAERSLEQSMHTLELMHRVMRDVAMGQATLEVTNDGNIVATHCSAEKVSLH